MGINDLRSKPGQGFRFKGSRSFASDLKRAAQHGDLNNLDEKNQEAIVSVLEKFKNSMRYRKGLSSLEEKQALSKLSEIDETITRPDEIGARQIFKHLGRGAAVEEKKIPRGYKEVKTADGKRHIVEKGIDLIRTSDGKGFLTRRQLERIKSSRSEMADEHSNRGNKDVYTKEYAGGVKVKSYGLRHGVKEDIGIINKNKTGFAGDYNKGGKLPDAPAARAPLGGTRPIGL